MTEEYKTSVMGILFNSTPDGKLGAVINVRAKGGIGFDSIVQVGITAEWVAALADVLGRGAVSFGDHVNYPCRARRDSGGEILELGREDGSLWLKTPMPTMASLPKLDESEERWPGQTPGGERALRYLNKQRALRGRRGLDPVAAGYNNDDIIADALHYGWEG